MNKTYAELQKENAEQYQGLFDFFAVNHDLVLTEGEMDDVINAVKEHAEQRQETASVVDTIVSGWIEIEGNEVLYSQVCTDDTMIKFDDGSECRYADDWSFAKATHFKIKGSH